MNDYTFTLTADEVMTLGRVLEEQPYKLVGGIIRKLEAQATESQAKWDAENEQAIRQRIIDSLTDEEKAKIVASAKPTE